MDCGILGVAEQLLDPTYLQLAGVGLTGGVPIGTLALGADAGLLVLSSRQPRMAAPFTAVARKCDPCH